MQNLNISQKVAEKFEVVTGIKLSNLVEQKSNIQLATFDKFSVTDEINLKLLSAQGVNSKFVKLQSCRKQSEGKQVFLFMVNGTNVKSFYKCMVEKENNDLKPLKEQKESISVTPKKSDNTRTTSNLLVNLITSKPEQKAIETKSLELKKVVSAESMDKKEIESLKAEISSVNAKFDLLVEMMNKLQK